MISILLLIITLVLLFRRKLNDNAAYVKPAAQVNRIQYQQSREKLIQAAERNDFDTFCKIHSENPSLLNQSESSFVRSFLLSKATICKNEKVTELLVNFLKNVKFDTEKDNLEMHLHSAVRYHNLFLVEYLLNKSVSLRNIVNDKDNFEEMIRCIFKRDNIKTRKSMLQLMITRRRDSQFSKRELGDILYKFVDKSVISSDNDAVDIVKILVNSGASLDVVGRNGHSLLHLSVNTGNIHLILHLISKGADVNKKNERGETPLHLAAKYGQVEIVELLLSNGADINAFNKLKMTALHLACIYLNEPVISYLIQNGANISNEDIYNKTPFAELLKNCHGNYGRCVTTIIKEFSKLTFANLAVSESDLNSIHQDPTKRNYFYKCISELNQMANTTFYEPYNYFSVLTMSMNIEELAKLARNEDFVKKFEKSIHKFSYYKDDLLKIFKEACCSKVKK